MSRDNQSLQCRTTHELLAPSTDPSDWGHAEAERRAAGSQRALKAGFSLPLPTFITFCIISPHIYNMGYVKPGTRMGKVMAKDPEPASLL